jgi:hypothetical protein
MRMTKDDSFHSHLMSGAKYLFVCLGVKRSAIAHIGSDHIKRGSQTSTGNPFFKHGKASMPNTDLSSRVYYVPSTATSF